MLRNSVMTALMLTLVACGGGEPEDDTVPASDGATVLPDPVVPVEVEPAAPELEEVVSDEPITLYALDCGTIEVLDLDLYADDGRYAGQTATFGNGCFVIEHPRGTLLWDLGLPANLVGNGRQEDGALAVSLDQSLSDQLESVGISYGDIEYVGISHSGFDHIGQPEVALGATWLVHQNEYDVMFGPEAQADYSAFMEFRPQPFSGDYDVFGDGSVLILELPGLTEGSMGLLVDLADAGPVMLSGGLYHSRESRADRLVPRFTVSAEQTRLSMEKFESMAAARDARVIIQNSREDLESLPSLPDGLQ